MSKKSHPEFSPKEPELPDNLEDLSTQGTYTLIILVPGEKQIAIGGLETRNLPRGYYTYTGSALGKGAQSLNGRIQRHLSRSNKKKRWHIDYLLSEGHVKIVSVIAGPTPKKAECEINQYIRERLHATIPIQRFGSSDCTHRCGSHLLYLGLLENAARMVAEVYSEKVGAQTVCLSPI
jgi:Uri superfamily endonuclease